MVSRICKLDGCDRIHHAKGYCENHYRKLWRIENPIKYAWINLKHNCKRRNKLIAMSYEEFEMFCVATDYIAIKGRSSDAATIDRIDNNRPYELSNIRILTNLENGIKQDNNDPFIECPF